LRTAVHLDPDVRAEMASVGRAHVLEEYRVELMAARTMLVYRDLLGIPDAEPDSPMDLPRA
jgi:hypothetical protein